MRRHQVRPYGQSITGSRTLSLLMSLCAIWMLYSWVRQPATWKWLDEGDDQLVQAPVDPAVKGAPGAAAAGAKPVLEKETIVPGPNDLDPQAMKDFKVAQELIKDHTELRVREMALYWRLIGWSRTEPFKKLESRADATLSYSQLRSSPAHYRAKLVRLRMHVRMVLRYDAAENDLGIKNVYEIWGATDDSKTFPYVVVVPELPSGLQVGPNVRGEIVFVGYFFKIMPYMGHDPKAKPGVLRAPMLLGRIRMAGQVVKSEPLNSPNSLMLMGAMFAAVVCGGILIRYLLNLRQPKITRMLPDSLDGTNTFAKPVDRRLPVADENGNADESTENPDESPYDSGEANWVPGHR